MKAPQNMYTHSHSSFPISQWEESVVSFWITACFLVGGIVSLILPWAFILVWTSRILVWGLFGPHMKFLDMHLQAKGQTDNVLLENFKKESLSARIRRQEAVKLGDMKCLAFGKYSTRVPSHNLSRHFDRPLPGSFARLHNRTQTKMIVAPHGVPGQQLFGAILPRTESEAVLYEKKLPELRNLQSKLELCIKSIKDSEHCSLLKKLKSRNAQDEGLPAEEGYELISYRSDSVNVPSDETETRLQLTDETLLSLSPNSNLAVLHKERKASSSRRRSSTFRGGFELIDVDEGEGDDKHHNRDSQMASSMNIGDSSFLTWDPELKLAVLETVEDHAAVARPVFLKHTQSWSAGDAIVSRSTARRLPTLIEIDGEVEVVLGLPQREEASTDDRTDDDDDGGGDIDLFATDIKGDEQQLNDKVSAIWREEAIETKESTNQDIAA
jgi:hypothetical protein